MKPLKATKHTFFWFEPKPYALLMAGLIGLFCMSFEPVWKLITKIEINSKELQTDRIGNLYVVSNTNQLYKYDVNGKLVSTLNYAYLGNISSVDASNPMELYLFYKELNAVVFLDNNLAYRGRLNLSDAGITQSSAACRSYSNGIWVFDMGDLQLKKLNKDGSLSQASGNVLQFAQSKNLNPCQILDNGSRVFVNDTSEGILVFDVFANYLKTIPIKGKESIRVMEKELYYLNQNKLISYKFSTMMRDTLTLPELNGEKFSVEKERLYLKNVGGISLYSYENQ
ncbi:MAG: hypothetical protein CFE21_03830 [Bacteroidetes bacterium B1(2017)]|nr:MAG: hypothetical protein CFE21_03830 [Bacteroidetes bacterium B1(2017)]